MAAVVNGPQPTMAAVRRALAEPGAQLIELRPTSGGPASYRRGDPAERGRATCTSRSWPRSRPSQTYQLWGIAGSQAISYGLIGSVPAEVTAFRVGHGAQDLAVTAEEAGGVVSHDPDPRSLAGPIK